MLEFMSNSNGQVDDNTNQSESSTSDNTIIDQQQEVKFKRKK